MGGLPVCTSEALRARKIGGNRAGRRRESLTSRGILPLFGFDGFLTGECIQGEAFSIGKRTKISTPSGIGFLEMR